MFFFLSLTFFFFLDGLDQRINSIIDAARQNNAMFIIGLNRKRIAQTVGVNVRTSVVGLANPDGIDLKRMCDTTLQHL